MSLRLTQGDENHLDSPIMILRGLEVVFDCAVNSPLLTALAAEVRFSIGHLCHAPLLGSNNPPCPMSPRQDYPAVINFPPGFFLP